MSASENRQRTKLIGLRMMDEEFEELERERIRQNFKSVQELIMSRQPEIHARRCAPGPSRARLKSAG